MSIPLTDSCVSAIERAREMAGDGATGDHLIYAILQGHSVLSHLLDQANADVYGLRLHLEQSCASEAGLLDAIVARATETASAMGRAYVAEDVLLYAVLENPEFRTTKFLAERCHNLPRLVLTVLSFCGYPSKRQKPDSRQIIESLERTRIDWRVPSNDHRRFLRELVLALACERAVVWRAETAQCLCQCPEGVPVDDVRLRAFLAQNTAHSLMKFEGTDGRERIVFFNRFGDESGFVLELERHSSTNEVNDGVCCAVARICASQR